MGDRRPTRQPLLLLSTVSFFHLCAQPVIDPEARVIDSLKHLGFRQSRSHNVAMNQPHEPVRQSRNVTRSLQSAADSDTPPPWSAPQGCGIVDELKSKFLATKL